MARLQDCIEQAVAAGRVSRQEAQETAAQIDAHEKALILRGEVSPEAARTQAEQAVIDARRAATVQQKRQAVLQAIAVQRAVNNIMNNPKGPKTGSISLLVKELGGGAGYSNVENRATAILGDLHRHFAKAMEQYRTKVLGLTQEDMRNVVRELFGTNTSDSKAKTAAKLWGETAEIARTRFNRAGGDIPKREDWGMPQFHDATRVGQVPREQWIEEITPLLDRSRIIDSHGTPLSDGEFQLMLDAMYDTIRTNGLSDIMPGRAGGKKLANRRQDHRVLVFKDADSWLKYHDKFGHQDIYTTLTDHLSGMANDIAKMEILGPNPEATVRYLRDLIRKKGESTEMFDNIWSVVSGKVNAVDTSNRFNVVLADSANAMRHYLVAAKLGGAFLSAISDLNFLRQTSKYNGMSATRVFSRMMKLFNPLNADDRLLAVLMGLTADSWVTRALAANRFTEVTGAGFSARVADFTMRVTLLSPWTDAGRKAFGMEFMAFVGKHTSKSFDELPDLLKRTFKNYGITQNEWGILRATKTISHDGVDFFSVENLSRRADLSPKEKNTLSAKIQEMILTETDYAVPVPDSRTRVFTTAGAKRGTIVGELARNIGLFKSFPITVVANHVYRGALEEGVKNKAAYLASLAIGTTLLGAIAIQAKELSRGKDPRSMTSPKFWTAAFIQGGGAGIFGDFLYSDANRFGRGPVRTVLGPTFDLAEDVTKLTLGNVQQAISGKDTNLGGEAVQFMRSYLPGTNIWYTRLAFEREVMDQLQRLVDPNARARFNRIIKRRKKEYGQLYWWRPGKALPSRAPQMEAIR